MSTIKATDRPLHVWYTKVQLGEIKLPRFQRFEAWDKNRIKSLLNTVVSNLPLGITLILEVGDEERFVSRYLVTAKPKNPEKVKEHLLDGQQRITALWRALHNNYSNETYLLYLKEYDTTYKNNGDEDEDDSLVHVQTRWWKEDKKSKKKTRYPLWTNSPEECLKRGYIPIELLRAEDIKKEIDEWLNDALNYKRPVKGSKNFEDEFEKFTLFKTEVDKKLTEFREIVKYYNLPYLSLTSKTPKEVALQVFINMNTNSKPLSQYDIIVAEIEGVGDQSLHDLQSSLEERVPKLKKYFDISYLILYTSALIQDKLPNKRGIWEMKAQGVIDNWELMTQGLEKMVKFLEGFKIYDQQRLPTSNVLSVIAALFTIEPNHTDEKGKYLKLLRKYLWYSFFTDRYENSAASRAFADFSYMKKVITKEMKPNVTATQYFTEKDIPVFNEQNHPFATYEQLLNVGWPKQENIRARGILAVANYFGAQDFASGEIISTDNIKEREYHHVFPDDIIEKAKEFNDDMESYLALNCALIVGQTNKRINAKEPLQYLKDRYKWSDEGTIKDRLKSHCIPFEELAKGGYDSKDKTVAEKIKKDYNSYLIKRAKMIATAAKLLAEKESFTYNDVINLLTHKTE